MDDTRDQFELSIVVDRRELVEWLDGIPATQLKDKVQDTLHAGYVILNFVQAAAGEEQMNRFFRPVVNKMDVLQGTLDNIIQRSLKSQRIGEMGEEIVAKQLSDAFPADAFDVHSSEGHQADIEAVFELTPDVKRDALIEVKFYTDDVGTVEIEKFRADLRGKQKKYGLLVSLSSRLTGVRGLYHMEETADYTALFVSNSGLDGANLICAAALLKAIMFYHVKAELARPIAAEAIEEAQRRLIYELEEIKAIARDVQGFRTAVRQSQQTLANEFNNLADVATSAEVRLQEAVRRLEGKLFDELQALPAAGGPAALTAPSPADDVTAALTALETNKDKRASAFRRLYEIAQECGLGIAVTEEGTWSFIRDGVEVARTAGTKTRLDLKVAVDPEKPITVYPTAEKLDKGYLVLDGTCDGFFVKARERLKTSHYT